MPASLNYTDIRIMRGTHEKTSAWKPNPGEPLFDLDNGILTIGDGSTVGGVPINNMTSIAVSSRYNLNSSTTIGRYFIENGILNGPEFIEEDSICILEVRSSDVNGSFIFQTLYVISGSHSGHIYSRTSETQGKEWNKWISVSEFSFTNNGTGTFENDTNVNNYINTSQVYIENIVNGPEYSENSNGILITYRPNKDSEEIYQILYITTGSLAGKVYYRFSNTKNKSFNTPGYNWILLDYQSISTKSTPNFIPRAKSDGKIDIGWLNVSDSININDSNTLATSAAVYKISGDKAPAIHTHTLDDIAKATGANVYSTSNKWDNGAITHIFMSTSRPSAVDGKNGDIWFQYV